MSNGVDCRTAPASPVLLKVYIFIKNTVYLKFFQSEFLVPKFPLKQLKNPQVFVDFICRYNKLLLCKDEHQILQLLSVFLHSLSISVGMNRTIEILFSC